MGVKGRGVVAAPEREGERVDLSALPPTTKRRSPTTAALSNVRTDGIDTCSSRARIQGSLTFVSLTSRLESNEEEEANLLVHFELFFWMETLSSVRTDGIDTCQDTRVMTGSGTGPPRGGEGLQG